MTDKRNTRWAETDRRRARESLVKQHLEKMADILENVEFLAIAENFKLHYNHISSLLKVFKYNKIDDPRAVSHCNLIKALIRGHYEDGEYRRACKTNGEI